MAPMNAVFSSPIEDDRPAKAAKAEAKWEDEHFNLFRAWEISWPPEVTAQIDAHEANLAGLSVRQREALFFISKVFPAKADGSEKSGRSKAIVEFVDMNCSLGSLLGYSAGKPPPLGDPKLIKSPWRDHPNTLAARTRMWTRIAGRDDPKVPNIIRPLEGWEYLALIGWAPNDFKSGTHPPSVKVCASLAGNAFSAFSVGPLLYSAFSCIGTIADNVTVQPMDAEDDPMYQPDDGDYDGDEDMDGGNA